MPGEQPEGAHCNDILIAAASAFLPHTWLLITKCAATVSTTTMIRLYYSVLDNCRSLGCITSVLSLPLPSSEKTFSNICLCLNTRKHGYLLSNLFRN